MGIFLLYTYRMKKGFTLVELLVVIGVIGIISSIVIASVTVSRKNALIAKTKQQLQILRGQIISAQGNTGNALLNITGSGCSDCNCRNIGSIANISATSTCYTGMQSSISKILIAADTGYQSSTDLYRDAWGSPFMIDENEMEAGSCANRDGLYSVGPDGTPGGGDDIFPTAPVPFQRCTG